jgi:hypothetical protein
MTALEATAGDVHATARATLTDSLVLRVPFAGGWNIIPPAMPAVIGSRSRAPRVLSERLTAETTDAGRYVVSLEGLARQRYVFRVRTPDEGSARSLAVRTSDGSRATIAATAASGAERSVEITFPATGANADGYTTATLTFDRMSRP